MHYLVDVGRLIPVTAVTAQDALALAELDIGCEKHIHRVAVYELGSDGKEVIRVIPCTQQRKEESP
ncbi:MAG: hypothetical protein LAO20_14200 [Acidobacteriia bacterium]|nr:hypothetical protein [Terriglobia bacterium]